MVSFLRKKFVKNLIITFIIKPLSYCLYPIFRIYYSYKPFKVGALHSGRIGHFANNTELYLCEKDHGLHTNDTIVMFGYTDISNVQLLKMWKRVLNVKRYANLLYILIRNFPVSDKDKYIARSIGDGENCADRDIHGLLRTTQPHLSFTSEEESLGKQYLESIGLDNDAQFVCFYARNPAYLETMRPYKSWAYHSYRDFNYKNQILAVEALTQKGYYAFRMGSVVKEALNVTNPMIIDYATNGDRNDFLDIYLCAKCYFFIASGSGLAAVPTIFRRPVVHINVSTLEFYPLGLNDVFIPNKLWLSKEKRFMTFKEILESGAGKFLWTEEFTKHGIELVENTEDEILEAAKEMDDRLTGTWKCNEEDDELQKRFWSIFPQNPNLRGEIKSRIGSKFLRQNRNLLDW